MRFIMIGYAVGVPVAAFLFGWWLSKVHKAHSRAYAEGKAHFEVQRKRVEGKLANWRSDF
jgi:hypothetical protein